MWAATPVTRAEPEKEAPAAAPLAVESAAPLAAAGAWLATLPPKVVVEAPAPPTIAPHGNSSSTVDDEGAASDFVYDGPEEGEEGEASSRLAAPPLKRGPREPSGRQVDHTGARLLHTVAAFATGEELRTWMVARSLPELMTLVQGVRSLQLEASQAQADAINAQVQLQLTEEARAAGGGGSGDGGTSSAAAAAAAVAAETAAGASAAAEAQAAAAARILELEEAVSGHAAALQAERASVATLERQLGAKGAELASLTQQLQGSILQQLERSNAQLSGQRKKGAR